MKILSIVLGLALVVALAVPANAGTMAPAEEFIADDAVMTTNPAETFAQARPPGDNEVSFVASYYTDIGDESIAADLSAAQASIKAESRMSLCGTTAHIEKDDYPNVLAYTGMDNALREAVSRSSADRHTMLSSSSACAIGHTAQSDTAIGEKAKRVAVAKIPHLLTTSVVTC